jgi:hypothetical protein
LEPLQRFLGYRARFLGQKPLKRLRMSKVRAAIPLKRGVNESAPASRDVPTYFLDGIKGKRDRSKNFVTPTSNALAAKI